MSKRTVEHFVSINNKKYSYSMIPVKRKNMVRFVCEAGAIDQEFLKEDVYALLVDLPELIIAEIEYIKKQKEIVRFRVSGEEKQQILKNALKKGYKNVSSFLRDLALGR